MEKDNIIELNGKAFDPRTGTILGTAARATGHTQVRPVAPKPALRQLGASMDGMVSDARPRFTNLVPNHIAAHRPQPTQTLMRQAVQPSQQFRLNQAKLSPAGLAPQADMQAKPVARPVVTPKLSARTIDPMRIQRARHAGRAQNVQHFQPAAPAGVPQAAAHRQTLAPTPAAITSTPPSQSPPPRQPSHYREITAARRPYDQSFLHDHEKEQAGNFFGELDQDLFEKALASADGHEQEPPRESTTRAIKRKATKGRKVLAALSSLAVFIALCGFVAYQNRTQIQLQLASAKAGFAATTPLYLPEGYSIGKFASAADSVASSIRANSKEPFTILEKKSNWDSQTLLENYVATADMEYRGYQSNGRTVYVFGKGNATWVNGGIWYVIKDAKGLSDETLVKIATSM